jgi:arylsulfatase
MSGTDTHRAGEGLIDTRVEGADGYEGYLNHRVLSVATRLHEVGYHTYMSGKWHLGHEEDQSPKTHGFERSFVLTGAGADHFGRQGGMPASYREDGKLVESLPQNFYSSTSYADKMIGYLKEPRNDGGPFFAYLAFTAPHTPLQAPEENIARQRGRYQEGYDVFRQRHFAAWKKAGFAPADAQLPNLESDYKPWASLSAEEQARSSQSMEVYAAMVERMDDEIGRVLKYLEESGQLNNTLIMFQSDNGPEGSPGSLGPGWAAANSSAFYLRKFYTGEAGIRVPAIVSAPALGVRVGRDDAVLIASDVAPTFLELAGADPAAHSQQPNVLPITGRSFAGVLRGDRRGRRGPNDVIGWEHGGQAAIRKGDWKLLWVGKTQVFTSREAPGGPPGGPGAAGNRGTGAGAPNAAALNAPIPLKQFQAGGPAGDPVGPGGPWRLFNLHDDPAERNDLSVRRPDVLAQMVSEWNRYVAESGVIVKAGTTQ